VRLEDLAAADEEGSEKIFRFLGLIPQCISPEQTRDIVVRNSFMQLSGGRPAGVEDPASHYSRVMDYALKGRAERCAKLALLLTGRPDCADPRRSAARSRN